jgi:hypothetical protein
MLARQVNNSNRAARVFLAAVAVMLFLALGTTAQACPTCGAGMAEGGEAGRKMLNSWFWSIMFMMSMPFAILGSLGGYMYWIVRKARREQSADLVAETASVPVGNRTDEIRTATGVAMASTAAPNVASSSVS